MRALLVLALLSALVFLTSQQEDALVYATQKESQDLAVKINCRTDEIRHFKYNGVTFLWGSVDGKIAVTADLVLHCLGNDKEGKYGTEALKYRAEISSLQINDNQSKEAESLKRRKRGIGDWFSNAWRKVKNFFVGLFGGTPEEEPRPQERTPQDWEVEDRVETERPFTPADDDGQRETEDEEEDSDYRVLYSEPFEFLQMANGSIPEIRFTDSDVDNRTRNFKRHLVDAFASQLSLKPHHVVVVETSVMGEHLSNYNITLGGMTAALSGIEDEDRGEGGVGGGRTVVVKKQVTEGDILVLAPNSQKSVVNDLDKMELRARQTQIFRNGELISTSGSSSLSLFPEGVKSRRSKRDTNDVISYFQAQSQFELQTSRIQKRSLDNHMTESMRDKDMDFVTASRAAELDNTSAKQRVQDLQKSIGDTSKFIETLLSNDSGDNDEKLHIVTEVVEQEVRLGLDSGPQSFANEVRKTVSKKLKDGICFVKYKRCVDLLQLLARAGGSEAEDVLLSYLKDDALDMAYRRQTADLLSDLSNPSPKVIDELIGMITGNHLDPRLLGSAALSVSNLATTTESEQQKLRVVEALVAILDASWSPVEPGTDPVTIDALEAIGNVGHESVVDDVLRICHGSPNKLDVQIACAHALRFMSNVLAVQQWMEQKVKSGPCDVVQAIIGSLLDKIHKQEMSGDSENWPRANFNGIDRILKDYVEISPPEFECATVDALRYFRRKKNDEARALAENYFGTDSEAFEPGSRSRQRRDLWDDLNCREWTDDNKYRPIQDKDEFESDKETYNKRKSCLANRKLGVKGASANIYAGMFAGIKQPSNPPKYKLFTKFVTGTNFLGHELEIGSFYFFHHSGHTKAYVRIMGKTRQEFRHNGCTPTELKYRPITHIPLYEIGIGALQLSLGIHLSSELQLETLCPMQEVFELKPLSSLRVGGEAMGTVLFARGAVNLGGSFNYHLDFTFTPVPDMCLRGQHGYEPMSISLEAYYQLWNIVKMKWGKPRTWRPEALEWTLSNGAQQPWFNDTCVLQDGATNEASTATPTADITESINEEKPNDNEILVVRAL